MATIKTNLEVIYEGKKRISDNSDKYVADNFDAEKVIAYKMFGDVLNVVHIDESSKQRNSAVTASVVEKEVAEPEKPKAVPVVPTVKK